MDYDPVANLGDLVRQRFRLLAGLCFLTGVLAVLCTWLFVPREYAASARLLYQTAGGGFGSALSKVAQKMGVEAAASADIGTTLAEILRSRTFALEMIRRFQLDRRWGQKNELLAVPIFRGHLGLEARTGGVLEITFWLKGSPRGLISSGVDKQTAQLAADIVNAMVEQLELYRQESTYEAGKRQRVFVEQRLSQAEEQLQEALDQLAAFQQQTDIMQPEVQLQALYASIGSVDGALAKALAEAQSARQARQAAGEESREVSMVASQAQVIDELKGNLIRLQMELAQARHVENKSDKHPDVQRLLAQIEEGRQRLAKELDVEVQALAVKETVADTQVEALQRERSRLLEATRKFPTGSVEHAALRAQVEMLGQARATLYQERELAAIQEEATYQPFDILDPALAPPEKRAPSALLNAVAAAFIVALIVLLIPPRRNSGNRSAESRNADCDTG